MLRDTDTSGWDLVGTEYWNMTGDANKAEWDTTWHSHGGDYMFRIPAHAAMGTTWPAGHVDLWEYDPADNDDAVVGFDFGPSNFASDYVVRGIGAYYDGADGYAEFYTVHRANYTVSGGKIDNVTVLMVIAIKKIL